MTWHVPWCYLCRNVMCQLTAVKEEVVRWTVTCYSPSQVMSQFSPVPCATGKTTATSLPASILISSRSMLQGMFSDWSARRASSSFHPSSRGSPLFRNRRTEDSPFSPPSSNQKTSGEIHCLRWRQASTCSSFSLPRLLCRNSERSGAPTNSKSQFWKVKLLRLGQNFLKRAMNTRVPDVLKPRSSTRFASRWRK